MDITNRSNKLLFLILRFVTERYFSSSTDTYTSRCLIDLELFIRKTKCHFQPIAALAVFTGILFFLYRQQKKENTLSRLVLLGLVFGSAFGLGLQLLFGEGNPIIKETLDWVNIVGRGLRWIA